MVRSLQQIAESNEENRKMLLNRNRDFRDFKNSLKALLHWGESKTAGRINSSQNAGSIEQVVLNYHNKNAYCLLLTVFT